MAMFIGCSRPADSSSQAHLQRPRPIVDAGVREEAHFDAASPPCGVSPGDVQCQGGQLPPDDARARLELGVSQMARGATIRQPPQAWKVSSSAPQIIFEGTAGNGACYQFAVVVDQLGRQARVELIDNAARPLASATGTAFFLVPNDGPICVPRTLALRAQLRCDMPQTSGLIVPVESL